jgi:hypothetical protein
MTNEGKDQFLELIGRQQLKAVRPLMTKIKRGKGEELLYLVP